jgi:hypothetical protein
VVVALAADQLQAAALAVALAEHKQVLLQEQADCQDSQVVMVLALLVILVRAEEVVVYYPV